MEQAWCPVCDRQIPNTRIQVYPEQEIDSSNTQEASNLDITSNDDDETTTQVAHNNDNTTNQKRSQQQRQPAAGAQQALPPPPPVKRTKSTRSGMKRTQSGKKLNKLGLTALTTSTNNGGGRPAGQTGDETSNKTNDATLQPAVTTSTANASNASEQPSSSTASANGKPVKKPRTILAQPASLYCSERCRLADQQNYASMMGLGLWSPSSSLGNGNANLNAATVMASANLVGQAVALPPTPTSPVMPTSPQLGPADIAMTRTRSSRSSKTRSGSSRPVSGITATAPSTSSTAVAGPSTSTSTMGQTKRTKSTTALPSVLTIGAAAGSSSSLSAAYYLASPAPPPMSPTQSKKGRSRKSSMPTPISDEEDTANGPAASYFYGHQRTSSSSRSSSRNTTSSTAAVAQQPQIVYDPDRANGDYFRSLRRGESLGYFITTPAVLPPTAAPVPGASEETSSESTGSGSQWDWNSSGDGATMQRGAEDENSSRTRKRHSTLGVQGMTTLPSAPASSSTRSKRNSLTSKSEMGSSAPAYVPANGYVTHFSGLDLGSKYASGRPLFATTSSSSSSTGLGLGRRLSYGSSNNGYGYGYGYGREEREGGRRGDRKRAENSSPDSSAASASLQGGEEQNVPGNPKSRSRSRSHQRTKPERQAGFVIERREKKASITRRTYYASSGALDLEPAFPGPLTSDDGGAAVKVGDYDSDTTVSDGEYDDGKRSLSSALGGLSIKDRDSRKPVAMRRSTIDGSAAHEMGISPPSSLPGRGSRRHSRKNSLINALSSTAPGLGTSLSLLASSKDRMKRPEVQHGLLVHVALPRRLSTSSTSASLTGGASTSLPTTVTSGSAQSYGGSGGLGAMAAPPSLSNIRAAATLSSSSSNRSPLSPTDASTPLESPTRTAFFAAEALLNNPSRKGPNELLNTVPVPDVLPPRNDARSRSRTSFAANFAYGLGGMMGFGMDERQQRPGMIPNHSRSPSHTPAHSFRSTGVRLVSLMEDEGLSTNSPLDTPFSSTGAVADGRRRSLDEGYPFPAMPVDSSNGAGNKPGVGLGVDLETFVPTYPMEVLPGNPGEKRKRLFQFSGF